MSIASDLLEDLKILEAKRKPSFGTSDENSYAVKVQSLDSNEFYKQPWGRQFDDLKKIKEFIKTAKSTYIGAKGKPTMAAVKRWVKASPQPSEFYASWRSDSSSYKDDSVQIYYKD